MVRNLITYLVSTLLVLLGHAVEAQVMMPSAQSNRSEMLIGEQAEIVLSLEFNKQNEWPEIQFPYLQDTLVEGLEIVEVTPVDTLNPNEKDPNLFQFSQRYTVTSFDSGYYQVKPFGIIVNGDSLFSNRLSIAVHTLAVDTTQSAVFDIKDIYEVELSWKDYLMLYGWMVLLVLFAGAGIVLLWYFVIAKPKKATQKTAVVTAPKIPAHITALEALAQLQNDKPWLKGDLKIYHSNLTDILRDYLEAQFLIHAHEQTSNEILQSMRFTELSQEGMLRLRHILKLADMVKFAKEKPGSVENERSLELATEFVQMTIPEEKPESQDPQNNGENVER